MQHRGFRFFALWGMLFLLLYQGCYSLPDRVPQMKDGKEYGNTEGLFRHRWWNYYERGLSFADGAFWQDAESDLKEAIRQRSTDERRAKTYGLHFIDYFPHRELGIVLFMQGRIEEAEKELELSYYTVKSAKAAFYLDRIRKALIQAKQLAHQAPEITVTDLKQDPEKPFWATIKGVAQNDAFVRHITVDKQEVRVDISDKHIDFQAEVPLVPGDNPIRVTAENLMGDSSELFINICVDTTGPVISFDELYDGQIPEKSLYVADDSGIAEIFVNKQKIPLEYGITEFHFPEQLLSFPETDELVIETTDIIGNTTTAKLPFAKILSKLLADNSLLSMGILLAQETYPVIKISRPSEMERLTYNDYAFIEGSVSDEKGIVNGLFIKNEGILKNPAKHHFFSRKINLDKGKNNIIIKGISNRGKSEVYMDIDRRSLLDRKEERLKIEIADFERVNENINQYPIDNFEDILISIMDQIGRFKGWKVNDKKGKSDFRLKGLIRKREKSMEILANLVDTDDFIIMNVKEAIDVYSGNINGLILENLAKNINKKLSDNFPLREGRVKEKKNGEIAINIGNESNIKQGITQIVVYDLQVKKSDNKLLDLLNKLGYATIKMVNDGASWASLDNNSKFDAIKIDQPVVTR